MAGWDDLEQGLPLDIRNVSQAREDLDRLALKVLGDEDGKKFFPAFVNSLSDKLLWQTIIKKEWVEIIYTQTYGTILLINAKYKNLVL
jgi:hypothetical protein